MVEVKMVGNERVENLSGGYTRGDYQLFIDGRLIEKAIVSAGGEATDEGAWFTIHIRDEETFRRVAACRLREFPATVCELVLKFEVPHVEFVRYVHLGADETVDGSPFDFVFSFEPKLDDWKEPYSPMDYYFEFQSMGPIYNSQIEVGLNDRDEGLAKGFYIKFPSVSVDEPIAVEYQKCVLGLQQLQSWVSRSLALRRPVDSLVSRFKFREEIRVPCEQYLLYFTRFLEDLGVEATADLRHEAGQVLFSVTPADKDEALDRIYEALMIYLGLSASPVSDLAALDYEIAIQRLVAEVQTLQSRVTLARAELQLKEATIQQQQVTIEHLRAPGGGLMLESLQQVTPPPKGEDREEVISGLVAIKKFEWNFLEVGLPELFRRLRRFFRDKVK